MEEAQGSVVPRARDYPFPSPHWQSKQQECKCLTC